jgi:hypothetical protein
MIEEYFTASWAGGLKDLFLGFDISDIHAKMCRKKISVGLADSTPRSYGAAS